MNIGTMNLALRRLLEKYGVSRQGELTAGPTGDVQLRTAEGKTLRLLPWRLERKFVELKNLVDNRTLEGVSTLRFANFRSGGTLDQGLYRELDLAEWLGAAPVQRVFAVFGGETTANMLLKLRNGRSCCVECGVMLPEGADPVERHELIASRGVASDLVVDTQVPQSSIYVFAKGGAERFTDTDAELYELGAAAALLVRAAFLALKDPAAVEGWNLRHDRILKLVAAARESERRCQAVEMEVA